ncbi:MAG: HlyD family efflux transporter periplasmic adaptor subunit [Sedimentitalea sp.]|nr:HlyD family efflux transporter periplasmic adaptor subunit [Sedimentitalea sp.]
MRFLRDSLIGLFLASLTLGLLIYAASLVGDAIQARMQDDKGPPKASERVFAVTVVTALEERVAPVLEAFGQVQSRRTLELRAATGGRIVELATGFEEGGAVRAGDVLLRIDPAPAQSALARAESDLLDAEAEERDAARSLTLARDELAAAEDQAELRARAAQRQIDLQARDVGTAAAVETAELAAAAARQVVLSRRQAVAQAEARLDQAATRIARAGIELDEARRDLSETTLIAGFDGTLGEVGVVEGRLVAANEKLALLVDPAALEVAFRVSTAQYARLLDADGALLPAPVTVALTATGAEMVATGQISRDSAAVGEGQSGRLIFAALDSAPGFKPGDFVTVAVEEPVLERVVRLPASALDGAGRVLALGPEDRLEALEVTLLRRQGDTVLVRGEGLAGREVVVGRTPLLGPGIKVRPLRPEAAAAPGREMLELSDERRAQLVALIEADGAMPEAAKARLRAQLSEREVPAGLVQRLEARRGG